MPFVSVVVPTYNRGRQAAAAVRSVLAQTEPDWDCRVVDDGSTDDTRRVLAQFQDPRLHFAFNEKNRGQHACRNQAIRESRSEWIAFLDSDDLYLPERLARLKKAALERPSAGFWFTNAYVWRFDRVIGKLFDPRRAIPEGRVPGWYAVGERYLPYVTTTVMVRHQALLDAGLFREDLKILEDTELYARLLKSGLEVGVLREALAVRFLHEGQITRDHRRDFEESLLALEAGAPPPEEAARIRRALALEVGECLWRSLKPAEARAFLLETLGEDAETTGLYLRTFLPPPLLNLARGARELALRLRHHPALAAPELKDLYRTIAPWLA